MAFVNTIRPTSPDQCDFCPAARNIQRPPPFPTALREQDLEILTSHQDEIINNYSVRHLGLFGSTARDDARNDSDVDVDVDVLVEFDGPATFDADIKPNRFLE